MADFQLYDSDSAFAGIVCVYKYHLLTTYKFHITFNDIIGCSFIICNMADYVVGFVRLGG